MDGDGGAASIDAHANGRPAGSDGDAAGIDPLAGLSDAFDDAAARFLAYARGLFEGAAAVFFRVDLAKIRLDAVAIQNALARFSPDPDDRFFPELAAASERFTQGARADLDLRRRELALERLTHEERVVGPLAALDAALAHLLTAAPPPAQ